MAWKFYTPLTAPSGYGTSLPASPLDGQEYTLVDSVVNPTYQWKFRYNASSANTDKWEFVGGISSYAEVTASETTASTTYAALTTAGPSIVLPRAGVYLVEIGVTGFNTANNNTMMSYDIGGTGAVDADSVDVQVNTAQVAGVRARVKAGLTAVTLTAKYRVSAGTGTFAKRWMRVTPVRVS